MPAPALHPAWPAPGAPAPAASPATSAPAPRRQAGRRLAGCALALLVLALHAWLLGSVALRHGGSDSAGALHAGDAAARPRAAAMQVSLRTAPAAVQPAAQPAEPPPASSGSGPPGLPAPAPDRSAPAPDRHAPAPASGLAPTLPAAVGEAVPAGAGAAPVPTYATRLPPSITLDYTLQRGPRQAPARLSWASDGAGYTLSLATEGAGEGSLQGLGAHSRGEVRPQGLAPERFVASRRGRERSAANFEHARGEILLSTRAEPAPLHPGTQDRVSWMLQLAGVLQANPLLARPGERIHLWVAAARGDPQLWSFEVLGPGAPPAQQPPAAAPGRAGPAPALPGLLHLRRLAERPHDLQVDVWVDPALHHLPWRVLLSAPPGPWASDMVLAWPAGAPDPPPAAAGPAPAGPAGPEPAAGPGTSRP